MIKMNKNKNASVSFIFVTILLDAIGIGLLIPVLPDVIRRFAHDPTAISQYFGYFIGAYALMQFLASPVLGQISDRYGRRPILLVSLLGAGLDYILMAFAPSLSVLFLGRIVSGLTGASLTVASSYMADISDDKSRSKNFGMIGAAWGLGFIAGPLMGGLFGQLGPRVPFLAAAVLNILNFLFGLFVLPESLPEHHRRQIVVRKLNPFSSIFKILRPSPFVVLIYIYFLLFLSGQVHPVNWTLYTQSKFGWSSWQVGMSLSFVGLMMALAQGGLTRVLIPKLGERRSVTFGIVMYAVCFALFGLAPQGWMMYPIVIFFSFSGVAMPALQSLVAKHIAPSEQGELQGSLVSLGSLSAILAPMLFTWLFVSFTGSEAPFYFPGAAYLGASIICFFALILQVRSKE